MKKLFALLFVLVLLPIVSFAELPSKNFSAHYTLFMDDSSTRGVKGEKVFDYDSLGLDLYMIEGGKECYFTSIRSFSGIVITGTTHASIVALGDVLYLADDSGYYFTVTYDENGEDLWIEYEGRSLRLRPVPVFSLYEDFR